VIFRIYLDKGVTWDNFYTQDHVGGMMNVATSLILLSVSGSFYFVLAVYRDLTSQVKLFPPSYHWWDIYGVSNGIFLVLTVE